MILLNLCHCNSLPYFLDDYDAYIIVSFVNATLVLSIGETVEEVTDSGFLGTTPTLSCSALGKNKTLNFLWFLKIVKQACPQFWEMQWFNHLIVGDDALVQVYPDGIRHIRADKRVNEWKAPGKKTVIRCAVNRRQVVIALSGGELVYFEMDPVIINILEVSSRQINDEMKFFPSLF